MDDRLFIRRVAERLACDEGRAEAITYVVFQELRDRLTPNEAADVAAQLPVNLKRFWQEHERPGREVAKTHKMEFVGHVMRAAVLPDLTEAERAVKAVFAALQTLLGSPTGREGEAWDVFSQLPRDLKTLWLEAGEHRAS